MTSATNTTNSLLGAILIVLLLPVILPLLAIFIVWALATAAELVFGLLKFLPLAAIATVMWLEVQGVDWEAHALGFEMTDHQARPLYFAAWGVTAVAVYATVYYFKRQRKTVKPTQAVNPWIVGKT